MAFPSYSACLARWGGRKEMKSASIIWKLPALYENCRPFLPKNADIYLKIHPLKNAILFSPRAGYQYQATKTTRESRWIKHKTKMATFQLQSSPATDFILFFSPTKHAALSTQLFSSSQHSAWQLLSSQPLSLPALEQRGHILYAMAVWGLALLLLWYLYYEDVKSMMVNKNDSLYPAGLLWIYTVAKQIRKNIAIKR